MLRVELTNIAAVLIYLDDVLPCGSELKDTGSYIPASNTENELE